MPKGGPPARLIRGMNETRANFTDGITPLESNSWLCGLMLIHRFIIKLSQRFSVAFILMRLRGSMIPC
jgi:hypothetical protein